MKNLSQTLDSLATVPQATPEIAEEISAPVVARPTTPRVKKTFRAESVLRYLPRDATPAQQDSAVQAHLPKQRVRMLSTRPDTLAIPGLPSKKYKFDANAWAKDNRRGFFKEKLETYSKLSDCSLGKAAEPVPYKLRSDDMVTGTILTCFFLVMLVLGRGGHFLSLKIKNFFYPSLRQESGQKGETSGEAYSRVFLLFQTCFLLGIFIFNFLQQTQAETVSCFPQFALLLANVGACLLYLSFKGVSYGFTNWVFFDKQKRKKWLDNYFLVVCIAGVAVFPLVLLIIYFDLNLQYACIGLLFVFILCKIILLWKCFRIFFGKIHGILHLIVYFCALEVMPLLVLWRGISYINNLLTVNF